MTEGRLADLTVWMRQRMKTLVKCSSSIWAPVSPLSQHVPITRVLCARYVLGVRCHRIDVARDGWGMQPNGKFCPSSDDKCHEGDTWER